jgi:hypothetical protein
MPFDPTRPEILHCLLPSVVLILGFAIVYGIWFKNERPRTKRQLIQAIIVLAAAAAIIIILMTAPANERATIGSTSSTNFHLVELSFLLSKHYTNVHYAVQAPSTIQAHGRPATGYC